ncbi:VOC family protein [Leucobacter rhizosphaerae]|uniref:VOC family protein n=1 Tax=Leucobacter rhizosphaerae TaxID=2932245 RepID=A0ABY4FU63_9MICO|nr:VOC family protein [Leucobacter rhizosphaerae]UOQ59833.1 VOC family protein [Leucobacter rhizosphaerae]
MSIGVRDAEATLEALRRAMGIIPLSGEQTARFRYVLTRMGDAELGMQLELIEPQGGPDTFMRRFLAERGEGVHHLTFTVPDVERTIRDVREAGYTVVQVDLDYAPWREAFIMPTDHGLGVVVQIADTNLEYPPMRDFISDVVEDPASIPHNRDGIDRHWWRSVRELPGPSSPAHLVRVELESEDVAGIARLFTGPLGGRVTSSADRMVEIAWGESVLRVHDGPESGVRVLGYRGGPSTGMAIGSARLTPDSEDGAPR